MLSSKQIKIIQDLRKKGENLKADRLERMWSKSKGSRRTLIQIANLISEKIPRGGTKNITELSESTGISYLTLKRFLDLFYFLRENGIEVHKTDTEFYTVYKAHTVVPSKKK